MDARVNPGHDSEYFARVFAPSASCFETRTACAPQHEADRACRRAPSPLFFAARGTPYSEPRCGGAFVPPATKCRGEERRVTPFQSAPRKQGVAVCVPYLRFEARARPGEDALRPAALLCGDFGPWRRASGRDAGGAASRAPYPGGFRRPSFPRTSSHQRQPVLVPADGWPGPPGSGGTSPARGRRARLRTVSGPAPGCRWLFSATIHPACSIIETSRDDALSRARRGCHDRQRWRK
jgi:hypothetical protein